MAEAQSTTMTEAEWRDLGVRLFGESVERWRFRCPTCGHVASIATVRKLSDEQREQLRAGNGWSIESECVGRYLADLGCNWCAYGLFQGPFFVERPGGKRTPVFGFDVEAARG